MNEKNDFALVPRPSGALEKVQPGAKRVLSSMVADTLALVPKEKDVSLSRKFRIGDYEWCEPDYRQILLWAKALSMEPQEVIRRLLDPGPEYTNVAMKDTIFADGRMQALNWDYYQLPLVAFDWVAGLTLKSLSLGAPAPESFLVAATPNLPPLTFLSYSARGLPALSLSPVPLLTQLWCDQNELTKLDLSAVPLLRELHCEMNNLVELDLAAVPMLTQLWCWDNQLTDLDIRPLQNLQKLHFDTDSARLIQRPNQHF